MPTGQAEPIRGFEPKFQIYSTVYDVKEGEPSEDIETARGDTTGDGAYKINIETKRQFSITIKALRKNNLNPHIAPAYIARADIASLVTYTSPFSYWPYGADIADATRSWRATIVWSSYSESFNAETGLVTLSAKGISTGLYKRPGDA